MHTPGFAPSFATHSPSLAQATHECVPVSQMGFVGSVVQSALVAHATHVPAMHTGVLPEHAEQLCESPPSPPSPVSPSPPPPSGISGSRQRPTPCSSKSHTRPPEQSVLPLQPGTHRP